MALNDLFAWLENRQFFKELASRSFVLKTKLGSCYAIIAVSVMFLSACDTEIALNTYFAESEATIVVEQTFGQLLDVSPPRSAHYVTFKLSSNDPQVTPQVLTPSSGTMRFFTSLDDTGDLVNCLVLQPKFRDDEGDVTVFEVDSVLPEFFRDEVKISLCNFDVTSNPQNPADTPLRTTILRLHLENGSLFPVFQTNRFLTMNSNLDVWAPPEAATDGNPRIWSKLGPVLDNKLRVAFFYQDEVTGNRIFINPTPYLADIPLSRPSSTIRAPMIVEVRAESSSSEGFPMEDLQQHQFDPNSGLLEPGTSIAGYLRFFFKLNETDGGPPPSVVPYEVSYQLRQGADIHSEGRFHFNSFSAESTASLSTGLEEVGETLFRSLEGVPPVSSPGTGVFWMFLPFETQSENLQGAPPVRNMGDVVDSEEVSMSIDLEAAIGSGQLSYGRYDLEITVSNAFGFLSSSKAVHFEIFPSLDATAKCSNDAVEDSSGVFVRKRPLPETAPVTAEEQMLMRSIDVVAILRQERTLRLRLAEGDETTVRIFRSAASSGELAAIDLPFEFQEEDFEDSGVLMEEIFVLGVNSGNATLRFEWVADGAVEESDEILFRVRTPLPIAGTTLGSVFPYFEPHQAFAFGQPIVVALDPFTHEDRQGLKGHVYVVPHRTPAEWAQNRALTDVTGTAEQVELVAGGIELNRVDAGAVLASALTDPVGNAFDVVVDFGDCGPLATSDRQLDPEDIIGSFAVENGDVHIVPDLTVSGRYPFREFEYGNDFEEGDAGAVCTPDEPQSHSLVSCVIPPSSSVPSTCTSAVGVPDADTVCVDTAGGVNGVPDGNAFCVPIDRDHPACTAEEICVNTNNDEVARCRPRPTRVDIPEDFEGLEDETAFRLRGRVTYPDSTGQTHPLVVIAHGRHKPKRINRGFGLEAIPEYFTSDENYRGHRYLQNHLSSHGYVTLSIDLDETYSSTQPAIAIRSWILLKNIDQLLDDSSLGNGAVSGNIDKSKIFLVGHSRGGESVLVAHKMLMEQATLAPTLDVTEFGTDDIKGIVSISPTSLKLGTSWSAPPIGQLPFLLIYGSADGDVSGVYKTVMPFRIYDLADGEKAAIVLRGGNHNWFNSSWGFSDADGKDRAGNPVPIPPPWTVWTVAGSDLRSHTEHENLAKAYVLAFLRLHQDGGEPYREFFTRSPEHLHAPGIPLTIPLALQSRLGAARRKTIDDFQLHPALDRSSSNELVTTTLLSGDLIELAWEDRSATTDDGNKDRFFQETIGAILTWIDKRSYTFEVTTAQRDLSTAKAISFRIAQQPKRPQTLALNAPLSLEILLKDGAGNTSSISSSVFSLADPIYDSKTGPPYIGVEVDTTSAILETIRLQPSLFATNGREIDLSDIRQIVLLFGEIGASPVGRIGIDDLDIER